MNAKKKLLIVITDSPPTYKGEEFLKNEVPFLKSSFDLLIFIHHNENAKQKKEELGSPLHYMPYLPTNQDKSKYPFAFFNPIFLGEFIRVLFKYKLFPSLGIINTLLGGLVMGKKYKNYLCKIIHEYPEYQVCVYSYWCNFIPIGLVFLKQTQPAIRCVSRAHGFDVYFSRNATRYLPFRDFICKNLDRVFFISSNGLEYSLKKIGEYSSMKLARLGSSHTIESLEVKKKSKKFTLVSCSSVIPLKRVNLIAEALSLWGSGEVHWVHFGDGPSLYSVLEKIKSLQLPDTIEIFMKGHCKNSEILSFYNTNEIDLFINVSESEGIPYSMIEAASFGIPLMGTRVGGVDEIIAHEKNGVLLPSHPSPADIAEELVKFSKFSVEKKLEMSKESYQVWTNKFNADKNFAAFARELSSL